MSPINSIRNRYPRFKMATIHAITMMISNDFGAPPSAARFLRG